MWASAHAIVGERMVSMKLYKENSVAHLVVETASAMFEHDARLPMPVLPWHVYCQRERLAYFDRVSFIANASIQNRT